jgi:hypothetical protein
MLASLFEFIYGPDAPSDYEDLKHERISEFLPITGRDWMIQIGNASRALHPYFLPAIFVQRALSDPGVEVWIIENWGFQDEYECLAEPNTQTVLGNPEIVTVSLTERSSRKYQSGEQYDDDNRFNLDSIAQFVDPKVNDLAKHIDPESDYPTNTIALQFSAEISEFPGPASELDNQPSEGIETHEVDGPDKDPAESDAP